MTCFDGLCIAAFRKDTYTVPLKVVLGTVPSVLKTVMKDLSFFNDANGSSEPWMSGWLNLLGDF